jgi:hypothetical protein
MAEIHCSYTEKERASDKSSRPMPMVLRLSVKLRTLPQDTSLRRAVGPRCHEDAITIVDTMTMCYF